jgi:hypothetical protein
MIKDTINKIIQEFQVKETKDSKMDMDSLRHTKSAIITKAIWDIQICGHGNCRSI